MFGDQYIGPRVACFIINCSPCPRHIRRKDRAYKQTAKYEHTPFFHCNSLLEIHAFIKKNDYRIALFLFKINDIYLKETLFFSQA